MFLEGILVGGLLTLMLTDIVSVSRLRAERDRWRAVAIARGEEITRLQRGG